MKGNGFAKDGGRRGGGGRRGTSWTNIVSHMYLIRIEHLVLLIDKKKPTNQAVAFPSLRPYGAFKYVIMILRI